MKIIPPEVSINKFKIENLNVSRKFMTVSFDYTAELKGFVNKAKFSKRLALNESVVSFVLNSLIEIKQLVGTDKAKINKEQEIKEKINTTLNRLVREMKNLEKIKDHEEYMKAFNRIHCFKLDF